MVNDDVRSSKEYALVEKFWNELNPDEPFPELDEPMESVDVLAFLGFMEHRLELPNNTLVPEKATIRAIVLDLMKIQIEIGSK